MEFRLQRIKKLIFTWMISTRFHILYSHMKINYVVLVLCTVHVQGERNVVTEITSEEMFQLG
jgi:hypothetical protein